VSYSDFDPKPTFRQFKRLIGDGEVGGKARGIAFAYNVIMGSPLETSVEFPVVNYVVTTEGFDEFVDDNGIEEILREHLETESDPCDEDSSQEFFDRLAAVFQAGTIRSSLLADLEKALETIGDFPLAIRSSSILEDSRKLSFAGKYGTRFSANTGAMETRRDLLACALKEVWASLYNPAARAYRKKHGLVDSDESMAVVIQPVIGREHNGMYYPEIAGTAFSKVYRRPSTRLKKENGVVRFCFGLGTRTVDRLKANIAYLSHPMLRPQGNLPADIAMTSQSEFDYIDRKSGSFRTGLLSEHLPFILKEHKLASAFIEIFSDNLLYWAGSDQLNGKPVFSFSNFPKRHPKFFNLVKDLAAFLEEQMGMPADMEFTYDTEQEKLTLLQLRPLASYEEMAHVEIPDVPEQNVILTGNRMVSNGKLENIHHLVFVDPTLYGKDATFHEVAREIGRINHKLSGTDYILVGPGRWGSTNPKLGVPVRYNEICHCGCLVEVGILESDYTPELSYGTHFFLDLDVDGTLYLPVFDGMKGNLFNRTWLDSAYYEQKRHPAVRHYIGNFSVFLDGEKEIGTVISND
jgi:hypothetical protein